MEAWRADACHFNADAGLAGTARRALPTGNVDAYTLLASIGGRRLSPRGPYMHYTEDACILLIARARQLTSYAPSEIYVRRQKCNSNRRSGTAVFSTRVANHNCVSDNNAVVILHIWVIMVETKCGKLKISPKRTEVGGNCFGETAPKRLSVVRVQRVISQIVYLLCLLVDRAHLTQKVRSENRASRS